MISSKQIRSARAFLNWGQEELAEKAGLAISTIRSIEGKNAPPSMKSEQGIRRAFEPFIDFLSNGGIQPKQETVDIYRGKEGFVDFLRHVHVVCRDVGGEIYVSNVNEKLFEKWMDDFLTEYVRIMNEIPKGNFWFKTIVEEGDTYLPSLYTEYRWISKQHYSTVPTYIYGQNLAIIVFEEDDVTVYVHQNDKLVNAFRKQFKLVWDNAYEIEIKKKET